MVRSRGGSSRGFGSGVPTRGAVTGGGSSQGGWQTPPQRYGLSDQDGLDGAFRRTDSASAATTSGGGAGRVGDAPFEGLGVLGIDMRLGADLRMPPVDPKLERATEEVMEGLVSSPGGSESETETESNDRNAAPALERSSGPTAAELLEEGARALERDRAAERERAAEE